MSKSKILFLMTGSIACYKACQVISRLMQNNCEVQVVASNAALKFVGAATLEGLSGRPVLSDMYASGNVMEHIHAMRWADLIVVAPATANFINKAAQGIGDDLLQTLLLAHEFKKPLLIAPAMNTSMYLHPITQKSLRTLRELGLQILEPASGTLACGEEGPGKLIDPERIFAAILAELGKSTPPDNQTIPNRQNSKVARIKVLVTAGGTQEPIDNVRVISNLSSGRTGVLLAETLSELGMEVTLLRAQGAVPSEAIRHQQTFTSFADLDRKIHDLLRIEPFTHVIHAAAVSDYSVANIEVAGEKLNPGEIRKISSEADSMIIHLQRNPKIISRLKQYSQNKEIKIIGFKLTSQVSPDEERQAVQKLFENSTADYVVHNDLRDINPSTKAHAFTLYSATSSVKCESPEALANELSQLISAEVAL